MVGTRVSLSPRMVQCGAVYITREQHSFTGMMMSPRLPVHVPLGSEPLSILQSFTAARSNILSIIPKQATQERMISGRTVLPWHMVMDPKGNREVLLEKLENYPKSDITKDILRPAIGESLFVAEGKDWRWQRRASAPAFSPRNIAQLTPIMTRAAEASAQRISAAARPGRALNLFDEMVATTFDVIADVTFSGDNMFDQQSVHDAIDRYIEQAARVSILDILGLPTWVPRPGRMLAMPAMRSMKDQADAAIERRRTVPDAAQPDLLSLLVDAADDKTGRTMTTGELRDNLLTFIVAGHETTALTLSWALYLCAFDPEVQDKARAQAQDVLGDRAATAEDLPQLGYIRQIIDETLRLYPAGGFLSRTAMADDMLLGNPVKARDTVMLPVYALHRHRDLWEEPDAFNPDRFADLKAIDRYAYLPFGDGPRICIGASFALQEAVIILATLLARFRFTAVPGRTPEPVMILTLRPEGGVWLTVDPA